jgi:tripartite-type tricarboxylate transporter receptor subunit TctC
MGNYIATRAVVASLHPTFHDAKLGGSADIHTFKTLGIKLKRNNLYVTYDVPKDWSPEKIEAFVEDIKKVFNAHEA